MPIRAILLTLSVLTGLALIVTGVAMWSVPSAFVTAGVGLIALACLALVEVG